MSNAITLLSGGLDSFVSTAIARKKHKIVLALTFDYGQRAVLREVRSARKICRMWNIPHKVIALPWLDEITNSALVNRKMAIPRQASKISAKAVWVPNRNALFINIAAAFAEALPAEYIVAGFNKEEGATFPDNSVKFVGAMNKTLAQGTLKKPKVVSYTLKMNKKEIARYAILNKLPISVCWPCYRGEKTLCGACESCKRFFSAFAEKGPMRI